MNCVKGDIARIVGLPAQCSEANDRFVHCAELWTFNAEPSWIFDKPIEFVLTGSCSIQGKPFYIGETVVMRSLQDKFLRPIRNPGDHAVDEMVRLVPRPVHEGAHA